MIYAIKIIAHHGQAIGPGGDGVWLTAYDPDGGPLDVPYPTGYVEASDHVEEALKFSTFQEAAELWRKPSTRTPTRPDGRPNRPLSAFDVQIQHVEGG